MLYFYDLVRFSVASYGDFMWLRSLLLGRCVGHGRERILKELLGMDERLVSENKRLCLICSLNPHLSNINTETINVLIVSLIDIAMGWLFRKVLL